MSHSPYKKSNVIELPLVNSQNSKPDENTENQGHEVPDLDKNTLLSISEGLALHRAFSRISDAELRKDILRILQRIAQKYPE